MEEVLYKIFDLMNGECTDVKRGELLDGKGGCYYLDYRYLAPSQRMKVAPNSATPHIGARICLTVF